MLDKQKTFRQMLNNAHLRSFACDKCVKYRFQEVLILRLMLFPTPADLRQRKARRHVRAQRARVGLQHGDHLFDGRGNSGRRRLLGRQQRHQEVGGRDDGTFGWSVGLVLRSTLYTEITLNKVQVITGSDVLDDASS